MRTDIVLIGPMRAGKSTVGRLLAQRLGVPQWSMDDVRFAYYQEVGYDEAVARRVEEEGGWEALYRHWKPFELHALERILADHAGCVFDLGAGHSVYEDESLFRRARQALAPYANIALLLPSPDPDECVRVIKARLGFVPSGIPFNDLFVDHLVRHHSNRDLATMTVFTAGQTPEETCDEILRRCV
jgi:hypothetical protein